MYSGKTKSIRMRNETQLKSQARRRNIVSYFPNNGLNEEQKPIQLRLSLKSLFAERYHFCDAHANSIAHFCKPCLSAKNLV